MTPDLVRTWSEPQRSAAVTALVLTVRADGRLEQSEQKALMAALAAAGLEDLARVRAADAKAGALRTREDVAALGRETAALFPAGEREALCSSMLRLAFADGLFQPQEQSVIAVFAGGLGVSAARLEELAGLAADTSPHAAAAKGRVAALEAMLDRGVSPNARDANGWTPLHVAVACGQLPAVELLLRRGADLTARHAQGSPPLFNACNKPFAAIVERLLAAGASVHDTGVQELTALHLAAMAGQLEVAQALARGGAKLEAADAHGRTPLHCAVTDGRIEVVRWLLESGAKSGAAAAKGVTPLHLAAASGFTTCARLLLDAGAPLDARDAEGGTPLFAAAVHDRRDVYELLVALGADPAAKTASGATPAGSIGAAKTVRVHVHSIPPAGWTAGGALEQALAGAPLGDAAAAQAARHPDWQLAVWINDDRSMDQVLVAGKDARGRPEYVSARKAKADARSRSFVVEQGGRRLLPLFSTEAAAAAFRGKVAVGWPEDGVGTAAAVIGSMPAAMFRSVADLPVDGIVVNPFGPGGPRALTLEECAAVSAAGR